MTNLTAQSSSLLQALITALLEPRPAPHPRHQALLDARERQLEVEAELSAWSSRPQPTTEAAQDKELDDLNNLLVEHAKAGRQVSHLLGADTCCPPWADSEQPPTVLSRPAENAVSAFVAPCILAACLDAFAFRGSSDALSSADLVAELRTLPGIAEGRWPYAELTQTRLATLLRPYEVASRDITHGDGRRRKSYRRSALLAAIPADCDCRPS
ncbi:DUF3631 domain-containing protein [Streptomyces sp. NBC_00249]|uniref:DUF3631 domain-containing protein n=1 Tax=Streptomyces sp. NBC_00249 TaxID=2975690 RepID=UPI00224CA3DC|nr:DUF3631 domain-containing protein [Streptomyces sp. NBC_00249]MCX5193209.1 DUF3631 domain-containing protein [Streptomyces sp. NBC_00249]